MEGHNKQACELVWADKARLQHRAPHIVQVQLGECMKNIVLVDFPDKWPSLLPQLTQNLQSQVCQPSCSQKMVYTDQRQPSVSMTLHSGIRCNLSAQLCNICCMIIHA